MANNPRKTDPRVIRTRQMLRDALISLILKNGYDDITIQDITDAAGLRRATFYLHYRDKEELLISTLQETFDDLVCQMEKLHFEICTPESEEAEFLTILRHAEQNAALYRSILGGQGAALILRFVRGYLIAETQEHLVQTELEPGLPLDVLTAYLANVKLNMVTWWLDAGMPYGAEQMAKICAKLTLEGAGKAFIGQQRIEASAG